MTRFLGLALALAWTAPLFAQDTIGVVLDYRPAPRQGLVVLPAGGSLDSARAIVQRDLDYSDKFQMIPTGNSSDAPSGTAVNYGIYKTLGADLAVELLPAAGGVMARLHDVTTSQVRQQQFFAVPAPTDPAFRLEIHRISDELTRWATGTIGFAASQLLFVSRTDRRVYRLDSDGYHLVALTPPGTSVFSPAWSPDGQRFAYTRFAANGRGSIVVQTIATGATVTVPGTETANNITPAFSPDGRMVAYAHMDEEGTQVYTAIADRCCAQRLTGGRFADNLSPTYSPDGQRLAFVSTRAGPPQVYVMRASGTDQELLAPFDYGATGSSNAPEWSPDGKHVVFHREVSRRAQLFLVDVATRRVRQLTSTGRNEDPTWAPDGKHIAFVSDRGGRLQLWVVDIESGRIRQLATPGEPRLPAWSRRLGRSAGATGP